MDWRDKAAQPKQTQPKTAAPQESHYSLLGLHPSASVQEIRSAYRELSKRYHPDTTQLAANVATEKFQQLNQAYAVLSSPERRLLYDQSIGYSRIAVVQAPPDLHKATVWGKRYVSSSAYLDPTDRPLSAGEIFALFILGLTVLGCLMLAIAIGLTRGDSAFQPVAGQSPSSLTITVTNSTPKPPKPATIQIPSPKSAAVRQPALTAQPSQSANRPQSVGQPLPSAKPSQTVLQPRTQLHDQPLAQPVDRLKQPDRGSDLPFAPLPQPAMSPSEPSTKEQGGLAEPLITPTSTQSSTPSPNSITLPPT